MCNNCPNANELDSSDIETCEAGDPDITTTDPGITITDPDITTIDPEETTMGISVPTQTITGIITQTPPVTPPSTTTQIPTAPPAFLGHKYRQIMRQLVGSHQCFVVHRQGKNLKKT